MYTPPLMSSCVCGSGHPRRRLSLSLESCTALLENAATRKMRVWEPCQSVSILYAAARSKQKHSPNPTDLILPALVPRMTANAATVCSFKPDQISQTLNGGHLQLWVVMRIVACQPASGGLLKIDSGYPMDAKVTVYTLADIGNSLLFYIHCSVSILKEG